MFSTAFIISLIRVATFVIFSVLLEKVYYHRSLSLAQKKIFNHSSRNNISAYIIVALSISTLLNTTEDSYIYRVNSLLAFYGPWLFILTGLLIFKKNLKYNNLLKKKIIENKLS